MSRPGIEWYRGVEKLRVKKDLENNPELIDRLGWYKERFISWCAGQRLIYEADIFDEVAEFEDRFIKSRLYNTDLKLWKKLRKEVFERDNYTCQYCGQVGGELEPDHIIPIAKGGTNDKENLATSCKRCNRQKRDKTLEEFNAWKDAWKAGVANG